MNPLPQTLEQKRKQRQKYSYELWEKLKKELDNFRNVSFGIVGGVFIATMVLDVSDAMLHRLVLGTGLVLFINYKLWHRSESKRIIQRIEASYPHRELYSDSPLYKDEQDT